MTDTKAEKARKEKTMTNREFFENIIAADINEAMTSHARHCIEMLDKRNSSRSSKQTKKQQENAVIMEAIMELFRENNSLRTASDIAGAIEDISSVQKASALARELVAAGKLVSVEIKVPKKGKQKAYSLPEMEETSASEQE